MNDNTTNHFNEKHNPNLHDKRKLGRRSLIRLVSFITAAVLVLSIASISGFAMARKYRGQLENTYQRALGELVESVESMTTALDKGKYANTPTMMEGLAIKLSKEADFAKDALSRLPVGNQEINATSKFLSQIGNFCSTLAKKLSAGELITDEETKNLDILSKHAAETKQSLELLLNKIDSGEIRLGEVEKATEDEFDDGEDISGLDGFKDIEDSFADYPALVYDGPFSDHIMQQKPRLLKDKKEVSQEEALAVAKNATGLSDFKFDGEAAGNLPSYNFTSGTVTVSVTKAGGILETVLDSRQAESPEISDEDAVKKAEQILKELKFPDVKMRYYENNHGVLIVNFAVVEDSIVLYPDLIKVGIALDTGELASLDAKGYIMNHHKRDIGKPKISLEKAKESISSKLKPTSSALVLVPSNNTTEVLCYEFSCDGEDDDKVLVFIDAETGMEEQILILLIDESGVLAN